MDAFRFRDGFSLGVATAATQIDGNCRESNWYDWYKRGRIKDGSNPDTATMHLAHRNEDTAMLLFMGVRDYRMGLEWARLEPEDGKFSDAAFDDVRTELELLLRQGIRPLLTIHHFSNPMWFERMGGFLNPKCEDIYLRFVREVINRLGDLVSEYITINEPNVYASLGFFFGSWPPGHHSVLQARRVLRNMGVCHRKAYLLIHQLRRDMGYTDTRVGFAHHMRQFLPLNAANPWHRLCAWAQKHFFQDYVTRTYTIGTRRYHGVYADFHGLNYYTHSVVAGMKDGAFANAPKNDLGWEIDPEGMITCAKEMMAVIDLPIYVTENGTCDNNDAFRCRYLYDHLRALTDSGLPFARYYHWCFVDNWEWVEGMTAKFGLVHLDTESMARTIKKSGWFYKDMIAQCGVTDAAVHQFLDGESYHT